MKKLYFLIVLFICAATHAQFYEGFENTTGPDASPSTNWTLGSGNWSVFNNPYTPNERWTVNSTISSPPSVYQGVNSAYVQRENIGMGNTSENYLTTPLVNIPTNGILKFYTRTSFAGDQGTIYRLCVTPDIANPTNPNSYAVITQWTENDLVSSFDTYEEKIVTLPTFLYGVEVFISFVKIYTQPTTDIGGDDWFIDNVSITSLDDCFNTGQCPQSLELIAFLDVNNNGIKDADEINYPYSHFLYQINNSGNIHSSWSNNGSTYILDNNPNNLYTISLSLNTTSAYYSCNTTYNNVTLPTGSGNNVLYFPVTIVNPFIDAKTYIHSSSKPKPGFLYTKTIVYRNNGSLPITSGTITFTKDNLVTINSISQTGTTPTADGFTYDFTNLQPFEFRFFDVYLQVPPIPAVQLGDLLTNSVSITVNNDVDLSNNNASITQEVVASFDPNDIIESHGRNIVFEDFTADDYLTYTIRFENTGTASAEFIRIEDALDSQLDENTFELISASHDVNVGRNGTQLTFHFYDINLPPNSINIDDGYGYVQFRIKPKAGYAIGDVIPNTASIYFDYNPAIVTNTFETEFVQSLNTSTFTQDNVVIYPNPASSHVQVALNNSNETISSITITDILGKTILEQQNIANNQTNINTSSLAKGMYLLKITSDKNNYLVKKLIIQ
jgi:uncharacterized repeat protein (TIGR01451 family)